MYLVAIAWIYVVLMMSVAEAMSSQGTMLGALITFVLYGVGPLALVLYLLATPARRRARTRDASAGEPPDGRREAPADAVAPMREEP